MLYMKHKLSITVGEDTLLQIREVLRSKAFRNKSHFFEVAATQLIKDRKGDE
jgi:hypothetical protein